MPKTSLRLLGLVLSAAGLASCQGSGASSLKDAAAPAGLNDPDAASTDVGKSRADCNKQGLSWIALGAGNTSMCGGPLTTRPCCPSALKARYATYGYMVDQVLAQGYQLYNCEQLPNGVTAHFELTPGDGSRSYYEVTFGDPVGYPTVTGDEGSAGATGTAPASTLVAAGSQPASGTGTPASGTTTLANAANLPIGTSTLTNAANPPTGTATHTNAGVVTLRTGTGTLTATTTVATSTLTTTTQTAATGAVAAAAAAAAVPPAEQCAVDLNAKYWTNSGATGTAAAGSTVAATGTTGAGAATATSGTAATVGATTGSVGAAGTTGGSVGSTADNAAGLGVGTTGNPAGSGATTAAGGNLPATTVNLSPTAAGGALPPGASSQTTLAGAIPATRPAAKP